MARKKSIGVRDRLTSLLPAKRLKQLARETGFVERERKIKAPAFLWALAFGFSFGSERTVAGLRRAYETALYHTLGRLPEPETTHRFC